jgi:hypothetical protein
VHQDLADLPVVQGLVEAGQEEVELLERQEQVEHLAIPEPAAVVGFNTLGKAPTTLPAAMQ